MFLMTAIFFDNDENAYRRFGSLITQKNELVDNNVLATCRRKH